MLRGNNGNTTEAEVEKLGLELETEVEVFDDLIDEPSDNDEPVIKENEGSIDIDVALEVEMAAVDIDIDEPFIMDMED